jgi:hypothetical protein
MYFPVDHLVLSEKLKARLRRWQRTWESLEAMEPDENTVIDEKAWGAFVNEGRGLARDLQSELGADVEVRLGVE